MILFDYRVEKGSKTMNLHFHPGTLLREKINERLADFKAMNKKRVTRRAEGRLLCTAPLGVSLGMYVNAVVHGQDPSLWRLASVGAFALLVGVIAESVWRPAWHLVGHATLGALVCLPLPSRRTSAALRSLANAALPLPCLTANLEKPDWGAKPHGKRPCRARP